VINLLIAVINSNGNSMITYFQFRINLLLPVLLLSAVTVCIALCTKFHISRQSPSRFSEQNCTDKKAFSHFHFFI